MYLAKYGMLGDDASKVFDGSFEVEMELVLDANNTPVGQINAAAGCDASRSLRLAATMISHQVIIQYAHYSERPLSVPFMCSSLTTHHNPLGYFRISLHCHIAVTMTSPSPSGTVGD